MADRNPRRTSSDPGPRVPRRWRVVTEFRGIDGSEQAALQDHRHYPLCRLLIYCAACGWARDYSPDRIIIRLRALQLYQTRVDEVAGRVGWNCPACGRVRWGSLLAYHPDTTARDVARATRAMRS